jgi:AraC family transcriptional regulator
MPKVQQPYPSAARKPLSCASKTENTWANGHIYAAIRHCEGADAETVYRRQEHTLLLTLAGRSDSTRVKVPGSPIYEGRDRTGCVTYTFANAEKQGQYRNANMEYLVVLIDSGFVRSHEFGLRPLDIPSFTNGHDSLLKSVLWSLAREMRHGAQGVPSVYVEHAAGLLMAHLVRSAGRACSPRPPRTGLAEASLRRVIEFIEGNLGQNISLTGLAALTGTGIDVFARNFTARMGVPPYRYVLDRRLLRARALLIDGSKSIAEIAFELGFSSQAHFTAHFSKVMNISPAAYRLLHQR